MKKILIVDDDESIRIAIRSYLDPAEFNVFQADNGFAALEILEAEHPDLVISDLKMPGMDGIELLRKVKEFDTNTSVVMMTGFDDIDATIQAMQLGAYDYLSKPIEKNWLNLIIKRALDSRSLIEKMYVANAEHCGQFAHRNQLVGRTPLMKDIAKNIGIVSGNRVSVLILGESGSGKEVIARTIHFAGVTKNEPFVALNCSALNETLLESELFGHEKGAFTGAVKEKKGKFELAGEGTIFLDEISETSLNFQVKLLRVIQEREFERVGGEKTLPVKARIIASTNKDLARLVKEGKFRDDLYFRLKVFSIEVPSLSQRKEDIPLLVVHLLEKINHELHKNVIKIPYDVMEYLTNYEYVGNVRELENMLISAVLLSKGNVLSMEAFPMANVMAVDDFLESDCNSLAELEAQHIKRVLKQCGGDKNKAAKTLGISRSTLYKKLDDYKMR